MAPPLRRVPPSRRSALLLALTAAALGACTDRPSPTELAPRRAARDAVPDPCAVTSTADDGAGSLREKLADATCGTVTFAVTGTVSLTSGQLTIARDVTVTGPGASVLTVARDANAGAAFRIIAVAAGATVSISGLTITGGQGTYSGACFLASVDGAGGGMENYGTLALTAVTVSGNQATGYSGGVGGGICNAGTLTLTRSTVTGNSANAGGGSGGSVGGGIYSRGTLTILESTVSNNASGENSSGGGIAATGTLTVDASTFSGNSAIPGGSGGAISGPPGGSTTVRNSTFTGNTASVGGAIGVENFARRATRTFAVSGSTFSGNSATEGGAIYASGTLSTLVVVEDSDIHGNSADGAGGVLVATPFTIRNTTISGNTAVRSGGGIVARGSNSRLDASFVTLTGNTSSGAAGGGIAVIGYPPIPPDPENPDYVPPVVAGPTATLRHSIVAGNTGGDCDRTFNGAFTGSGANLDGDGTCAALSATVQTVTAAQLKLGPLQVNAPGTTKTIALLAGSAAIDAAVDCNDVAGAAVVVDQRGAARPAGNACDVGAFEAQLTPQAITITSAPPASAVVTSVHTLAATGGASGNPVVFASQTLGTCTTTGTNGATLTLIAAGACTVRATQAGNATYAAATPVTIATTVLSPAQATRQLESAVTAAPLTPDLRRALTSKLDDALTALAAGKTKAACTAYADFISQVQAQRGKSIPIATADAWIAQATALRRAIGC